MKNSSYVLRTSLTFLIIVAFFIYGVYALFFKEPAANKAEIGYVNIFGNYNLDDNSPLPSAANSSTSPCAKDRKSSRAKPSLGLSARASNHFPQHLSIHSYG